METQTTSEKENLQKLLSLDKKTFFAKSMMFMLGKTIGLLDGTVTKEQYDRSQQLVNEMTQAKEWYEQIQKPLPKWPEKGWLFPYLIEGDKVFGVNRWEWWTNCQLEQAVNGKIPQVQFHTYQFDLGVKETLSHLENLLRQLEQMIGASFSLLVFVQWLLWGFGSNNIKDKNWDEKIDRFLYEKFELGRMQKNCFDYFAILAQESKGKGRWQNPTAFFQTPPNVCQMMIQMIFTNSDENSVTKSVCDPCAGTGTMLLFASNYSVNLFAQEICLDLCLMLEANAYLYVPWLVRSANWLKKEKNSLKKEGEISKNFCKKSKSTCEKKLVLEDKEIVFKADSSGQLNLFE